jgi:plastocyanin
MRWRVALLLLACGLLTASASGASAKPRPRCAHKRHEHKRRCRARHHATTHPLAAPTTPSATPTPAQEQPTGSTPGPDGGEPGSAPPPAVTHVQVSAVEFRYTLSRSSVPAGKVVFEFVDAGQDEHNLNVGSSEGELELSFATAQPKAVSDESVVLRKGTYTLFCSLPEHEAKGMKATLTVQ